MPYRLKVRLMVIGKTQTDLQMALKERGYKISTTYFNRAINGHESTKTLDLILSVADQIVTEWENNATEG